MAFGISVFESDQLPLRASKIDPKGFLRIIVTAESIDDLDEVHRKFFEMARNNGANAIIGYKVKDFVRVSTKSEFMVDREISGNAIYYEP